MIYAGESKLEKTHSTDIWGRKSLSQTAGQLPYSSTPHHNVLFWLNKQSQTFSNRDAKPHPS